MIKNEEKEKKIEENGLRRAEKNITAFFKILFTIVSFDI